MQGRNRACDRCYRIKEKCEFVIGTTACTRCRRLRHTCEARRPILRPGPRTAKSVGITKVKHGAHDEVVFQSSPGIPASIDDFTSALRGFDAFEVTLLEFMFDKTAFIGRYVEGAYFQEQFRGVLTQQLVMFPDLLKDIYLACVEGVQQSLRSLVVDNDREKTIQRSARSLKKLMSMRCLSAIDLSAMLTLALGLITFSTHVTAFPTLPITRAVLRPLGGWLAGGSDCGFIANDPNLVCVLFHETVDCLVRQEVPSFRIGATESQAVIDRYLGVCSSLLPLLYDLCYKGAQLQQALDFSSVEELTDINLQFAIDELATLWLRISEWSPILDANLMPELLPPQIEYMQIQAVCFQLAAKLLILEHIRVTHGRYPHINYSLPVVDRVHLARSTLLLTNAIVFQGSRQFISFPHFVAALVLGELHGDLCGEMEGDERHESSRVRENLAERLLFYTNGTSEASCRRMSEFAHFVWDTQDRSEDDISWLELINQFPAFSMAV